MNTWEIIEKRISCRAYEDRVPERAIYEELCRRAEEFNAASGLHIQLFFSETKGEPAIAMSPSMFTGPVYLYAALVGKDDDAGAEAVGYFGQKLVLFATELGLGTCWVASTYDRSTVKAEVREGERLWDVVPMGYAPGKTPAKQKMIRAGIRAKDRPLRSFVQSPIPFEQLPEWVKKGAEAVRLGPSAVNGQPIDLVWDGEDLFIKIVKENRGLQFNDLGIAKAQFEAAAECCGVKGAFGPGDGALFVRTE